MPGWMLSCLRGCPGGCLGDAGMLEGMPRRMQGCPGEPVPVGRIEAFPSKRTLRGAGVSDHGCRGSAGSQEPVPGASRLCLVHVAMAGWRGQQPQEVEQDTKT